MTEWKGTPLKNHSCHGPPESVSHGVPTETAAQPKPVCGEMNRSHASTRASWSSNGSSTAQTPSPSESNCSRVQEVDVRVSRSSLLRKEKTTSGKASRRAPRIRRHDASDG